MGLEVPVPGVPLNLPGATLATRYVGGTATVAPTTGTFAVGDFVIARNGNVFVCTVAGTPGTWVNAGSSSNLVTSVFGRVGAVAAAASDYTYAQIAAAANAVAVSNLAAGLAGQVIGGTTPAYVYPPGFEVGYDEITAPVTVTSVTEATGTAVISCAAHTFDGAAVVAEFFAPSLVPAAGIGAAVVVCLFAGATQIGRLCVAISPVAAVMQVPGAGSLRFTPTAAAHTYTVTAFQTGGNGTVNAGASGTGAYVPASIRFVKV